jgi:hypothetical protein
LAALVALAAVAAYGIALWKAPGWMHATQAQDRYNARVLVVSVGGAFVVGAGLLYTARNYRLSRRGQVTERFANALERLASAELYVRIGGVHALEQVMRNSASHHDDVMQVLAAFIRNRAPAAREPDSHRWMHPVTASDNLPPQPELDIQAALTAIAQRPHRREHRLINLKGLHLVGADLNDADLVGVYLNGANLTGGRFFGANLTGARLIGANLTDANLSGARLAHAWLDDANLARAQFHRLLVGVWWRRTDLTKANLSGANLTDVDLRNVRLTRTWLWRLYGANLTGTLLGADPPAVPIGWTVIDSDTGKLAPVPAHGT